MHAAFHLWTHVRIYIYMHMHTLLYRSRTCINAACAYAGVCTAGLNDADDAADNAGDDAADDADDADEEAADDDDADEEAADDVCV